MTENLKNVTAEERAKVGANLIMLYNRMNPTCPDAVEAARVCAKGRIMHTSLLVDPTSMPSEIHSLLQLLGHTGKYPVAILTVAGIDSRLLDRMGVAEQASQCRVYGSELSLNIHNGELSEYRKMIKELEVTSMFNLKRYLTHTLGPSQARQIGAVFVAEEPKELGFFAGALQYLDYFHSSEQAAA